ncbi:uncharacterized mitochondrial protein AtMg00810-like [Aristolochia californica]|uniref:uncharacterized mitochondrial protein AtMg00810-like n=1 Tax=Aristolochia californica TaxID=171875 RepID=UPI0035DC42B6
MYFLDLLEETGMMGCRPANTPMDSNKKLCAGTGEDVDIGKYQILVVRLICLCVTRPDISYAVTMNHGHFNIEGFSDVDWAGSSNDRKSPSRYCTIIGGNLVTWRIQNVVAWSSVEEKYRAMAHTSKKFRISLHGVIMKSDQEVVKGVQS